MNRPKNNPQGMNDKKKVNHSLEMSTTDLPSTPPTTSKRPATPTKGIFMLDSVYHIFSNKRPQCLLNFETVTCGTY